MLPHALLPFLAARDGGAAEATVLSLLVGVNYGSIANNLPSPAVVTSFLATRTTINRVKIFDANPAFISAFASTAISLAVSLPTLADKATGLDAARQWIRAKLSPYVPATNITLFLAGNKVLYSNDKALILALLPAMRRLAQALCAEGLPHVRDVRLLPLRRGSQAGANC